MKTENAVSPSIYMPHRRIQIEMQMEATALRSPTAKKVAFQYRQDDLMPRHRLRFRSFPFLFHYY